MIKILVADDFELLREDLAELINAQDDMEVLGMASSGGEIVELALAKDFDVVLMDIEMENVNAGIIASEQIMDEKPDATIIFLTAHELENVIITAMATGAVDYIIKGSSEEEILMHVRKAYEGSPVMDAQIHETVLKEYTRLRRAERSLLFFINNISQLTAAERELIKLLLQGKKVKEIAALRFVEVTTVKTQINGLLKKFGVSRTKEIVGLINELNISHLF